MDRMIRTEVARFLEKEQMTEANLIKLDKRLAELISNAVGSQGGHHRSGSGDVGSRVGSRQEYNDVLKYKTTDSRASGSQKGGPQS